MADRPLDPLEVKEAWGATSRLTHTPGALKQVVQHAQKLPGTAEAIQDAFLQPDLHR